MVEPVKIILSILDRTSAAPASPKPVINCTKLLSYPHAFTHSLINVMPKVELYDVCSDTLITTALPANNPEIT